MMFRILEQQLIKADTDCFCRDSVTLADIVFYIEINTTTQLNKKCDNESQGLIPIDCPKLTQWYDKATKIATIVEINAKFAKQMNIHIRT